MSLREGLFIVLIIILALLLQLFVFAPANNEANYIHYYAVISITNYPSITVPLSENQTFSLPHNPNIIFTIEDNAIAFTASDCPDLICVRTGFLRLPNQSAVCLPNRVLVVIRE